jgi:hypothetical protein
VGFGSFQVLVNSASDLGSCGTLNIAVDASNSTTGADLDRIICGLGSEVGTRNS